MKIRLPDSTRNWLSISGAAIASISFLFILFFILLSTLFDTGSTYMGLITYILLPAVLIAGLIMIPIGMIIKNKKMKDKPEEERSNWPVVDLNNERTRNAVMIFAFGTVIFIFLSAVGSYEAYHYTESVEFCGTVCHEVMKPEYVAYQNSPHSRVTCVECHVGTGADWYVKSKLSGLYQIYSVLFNAYSRPIETPIHNLRPARETCEQCHWPEKFIDRSVRSFIHYLPDETNTRWELDMVMKIAGSHPGEGLEEGSHWHINKNVKIDFIARDEKQIDIPWVRYTDLKTGTEYIYEDEDDPLTDAEKDSLEIHEMDCIDCHSRPSHNYQPPAFFVNTAMASGSIPPELPEIKSLAMEICSETFGTEDSAMMYIENEIRSFYAEDYPGITDTNSQLIDKAVTGLQNAFKKNIFPEMNVRWNAYPNHIGHIEFKGCFRCHNDLHYSEERGYIKQECRQCHDIIKQGAVGSMEYASIDSSLTFLHPEDIGGMWTDMFCTDCHTGLNP